ncbi:Hop family adhesin SabA [Helicobacter pylori]|uniref:Hop family adhesin SabA n=1 Tax=Helicobacter pylori TaxID=210 RepID=UPI00287B6F75|nr:Hop family adhesin SabA [Helicobacter pylori]WNE31894.1 Hop family adhesin SabA [Helicobacter pylori]WNE33318.1 Hop family adhesin SabA [Helicobacter pylori]WNE34746.1 Hop family adhesin SabA [Helicobacter pylori]WNE36170.1 Hop family adhesin SabA [Helicobacter pylori]WNE37598.1 Hop family adhesin SabA [Helicobacter pylori]
MHAEDNGFFVSAGYQIGEAVQMVKNTGELKNLNEKYEQLNQYLNQVASLKQSIQNANNIELVNSSLNYLKSFTNNNYNSTTQSPIFNAVQAVITSVLGFWSLYAGNYLTFFVVNKNANAGKPASVAGNPPFKTIVKNCSGIENCAMDQTTYDKMKKLAEGLQAAQQNSTTKANNLCTLSGCATTNGQNPPNSTVSNALNLAQQLMDLIANTKTAMMWKNIVISGVSNEPGAITSTNYPTQYAVFNNIKAMIPILQQAVTLSQNNHTLSASLQAQATGSQTNPKFAKDIYAFAQNQKQVISYAKDIFNLFNSIPAEQYKYLEKAYLKIPNAGSTPTNPYRQEVNLNQEVQTIQNNVSYYGNRVDAALSVAKDVYNLKSNQTEIVTTYNDVKTLSEEISKLPHNQVNTKDIVTLLYDKNAPAAGQYNYQINPEQQSNLSQALAAMSNNPFKKVGMISSQNNNGAMNGLGVQVGYKQFFGESKRWGLRYYGFFDYNHGYIKSSFFNSSSDVWTYGGGSDLLFNFLNDKATKKNNKLSVGLFGGIQLAGTTWLNSQYVNLTAFNNPYSAKVNASNFQFLFNLGLRMNLATAKKKDSEHSAQHGMELGVKIPTINTNYYSFLGTQLQYRRLYSVYLNYVFAY